MFKKLMLMLLCTASMVKASEIDQQVVKFVIRDTAGVVHEIQPAFIDPILRNIPADKFEKILKHLVIRIVKLDNDEYVLHAHIRGNGGLVIGAAIGAFVGKATVSIVGHGAIALVSLGAAVVTANPAVGWGVGVTLESWFGVPIEAASLKGAVAGGIIGGVATGPI